MVGVLVMDNKHIMRLVADIDALVDEHAQERGDETAFDALGALGYFSGLLLANAPDRDTQVCGHRFFMEMLNEGLTQSQATRH
jgi:hypothetical protein